MARALPILVFLFSTKLRETNALEFPHLPTLTDGPLLPVSAIPGRLVGMLSIPAFAVPARLPDPDMTASITKQEALVEPELPMLNVSAVPSPRLPKTPQQLLATRSALEAIIAE